MFSSRKKEEETPSGLRDMQEFSHRSPEVEVDGEERGDDDSSDGEPMSWIEWFVSQKGNELLCEVDEEFIQDSFNLYGLPAMVRYYQYVLDIILDNENDDKPPTDNQEQLQMYAELLYGLIHARFITTARGLSLMRDKYRQGDFGRCPRVSCQSQGLLPVGLSDLPGNHTVKMYCPRCEELYFPKLQRHVNVDGAFFGTSFAHLLLMQYPELCPQRANPSQRYVPKVFGFRLHKSALPPIAGTQPTPQQAQVPAATPNSNTPAKQPQEQQTPQQPTPGKKS
eukprot:TRINITY_DN18358_c0_g1_i1.p1 TRINITY_DN18358_c0_g1~~TRINITY_DN18358_c0_g1_i1.p1  ORF type:complete len:281 (-),score=101.39 TRINITY_DN18358_c0_g1_i1:52-894(-)